jgi:RNA polymerase-binding transcription factor DksA
MTTDVAPRSPLPPEVERALHERLVELRRQHLDKAEPPEWKNDVDIEDRDMVLNLAARAQAAVEEIDAALTRIADGTYGQCEGCLSPLPRQRLEAVPTATKCLACAGLRVSPGLR